VRQFGASFISPSLLSSITDLTSSPLHPFLSRSIFYSHRDLDLLLREKQEGKPFFIYTGRGPSSGSLHLGFILSLSMFSYFCFSSHLIPFIFSAHLQRVFGAPVVIQLSDDEKFLHRDLTIEKIRSYQMNTCAQIIACGFDLERTFIFSNIESVHLLYPNVLRIQKCITNNQVRGIFGVTGYWECFFFYVIVYFLFRK